jgi:hypothetical protein
MCGNGAPLAGQNRTLIMLKKMNGKPTILKENGCEYCEAAHGILGKMLFDAVIALNLTHTVGLIAAVFDWFRPLIRIRQKKHRRYQNDSTSRG